MGKRVALTGNEAVAIAMRQVNPDVVAAYPITPQTDIVQYFSSFVADGLLDTEFVTVESEHSAMSATVGAAAAGARAMTATSANGLALMWEVLYIAAGDRLPIVMTVVNRALAAPLNIHCDHSDAMGARDSGWVQLWSEDAQEAYDNLLQAIRIAEHPDVRLPVMVCLDGFIISHALLNLEVFSDDDARRFVGPPRGAGWSLLDAERPVTIGALDLYDFYFEHKRQQAEAMRAAGRVISDVAAEFAETSGRGYGLFNAYRLDDAETAIVVLGSAAGTARYVVDQMRACAPKTGQLGVGGPEAGPRKVGLLKLRVFRPFPAREIARALSHLKAVAILDRADSFSAAGGPLFAEVRSALYSLAEAAPPAEAAPAATGSPPGGIMAGRLPVAVNFIYGLGGRDLDPEHVTAVFDRLSEIARTGEPGQPVDYLGVRE